MNGLTAKASAFLKAFGFKKFLGDFNVNFSY